MQPIEILAVFTSGIVLGLLLALLMRRGHPLDAAAKHYETAGQQSRAYADAAVKSLSAVADETMSVLRQRETAWDAERQMYMAAILGRRPPDPPQRPIRPTQPIDDSGIETARIAKPRNNGRPETIDAGAV